MTKRKDKCLEVSYRTLQDDKSLNLKINGMVDLDVNALEDFFLTCVDCELIGVFQRVVGYFIPRTTIKYRNISFIGSYLYGTERLTTDRIIIKHVKKSYCDQKIIETWFKQIYGNTFRIDAFSVSER